MRKYARLFSQLSGRRQEEDEEAISWSSSDEDDMGASALNSTVCRRSKVTRKLNSQINFDNRINAKKNGRRLTSAEFSRSVEYLTQDLLANAPTLPTESTPDQHSQTGPKDSSSVFNNGILIDQSQNLTIEPENSKSEDDPPSTPRPKDVAVDSDVTSPVFKLITSRKKKYREQKGSRSERANKQKSCEEKALYLPVTLPSINNNNPADDEEPLLPLTPEIKTIDGLTSITSPVLGKSISSHHKEFISPVLNRASSLSPVMRRTAWRKRPHNTSLLVPKSPVLEPKKRIASFKRKRRKLATPKNSSQSRNATSNSDVPGTSEVFLNESVDPDSLKLTVKRSLDFAADEDLGRFESNAGLGVRIEASSMCEEVSDQPFPGNSSLSFRDEDTPGNTEVALNATNFIEEVRTEELDLPAMPIFIEPKKSRLSLRNSRKRRSASLFSSPEIIESSQSQSLTGIESTNKSESAFKAPLSRAIRRAFTKKSEVPEEDPTRKPDFLNQTNMIEEVCTEDLLAEQDNPCRGNYRGHERPVSPPFQEILSPHRGEQVRGEGCAIDESFQIAPEEQEVIKPTSKLSKTLAETSEEMRREFRGNWPSKDQDMIISQSSTKSGDPLKSKQDFRRVVAYTIRVRNFIL